MNQPHRLLCCLLWLFLTGFALIAQAAGDATPDPFSFADKLNVALRAKVTSNTIAVKGIDMPATISISGGKYAINGGAFKETSATISKGQTVRVRVVAPDSHDTLREAILTIGGISTTFTVKTIAAPDDKSPDAFSFDDPNNVALTTKLISNPITVNGLGAKTPISITGGKFSINGGAFRTGSTTISNGKSVRVQQVSAATAYTPTDTVLTIGTFSETFRSTTLEGSDRTPNPFVFTDQFKVALNTPISSNAVTITGINAPAGVTVTGGLYSINGGEFTSESRTVTNGQSIAVRVNSAATHASISNVTLNVGGMLDVFTVLTQPISDRFFAPAASGGDPGFKSEHFMGASNCAVCHNGLGDSNNKDVSIETDWSSTMMANSSRDPLWRAKVRSELKRNPQLAAVINDKCTRCHAPMANFEAKTYGETKAIFDGGFLSPEHLRHNEALSGVNCTVCHQIQNAPSLGTLSGFSGQYQIDPANANNDLDLRPRTIYGPFDNLTPDPMVVAVGYEPTFSTHIKSSKLCATCHNLKTPYVDQFGKVLSTTPESEFPEQMVYSEWEQSEYASTNLKSCQACHMSRANGVAISNRPSSIPLRDGFAIHEFVGANKLMLDIFNNNKPQLGVLANNFAETIEKTQAMLNRAASITPLATQIGNDNVLQFTLQIDSKTGHKLPTSYPSRRVILHVTVKDADNKVVFESGKINANGSVVGLDADTDGTRYEPHYEVISAEDQVQVYEAVMKDNENNVTYTLLRGMAYAKDNRLLPKGFVKANASDDVKVVGEAYEDSNFVGGSDQVRYQISGLTGGTYQVEAELVHQPVAYAFAADLFKETDNEVEDFKIMFNASNAKSNRIALSQFTVAR